MHIVAASLISPWLLWWPLAESHYNIYDHSAVGYVSHVHCIVLLYSVENKITDTIIFSRRSTKVCKYLHGHLSNWPVQVKQRWRIWINGWHKSTTNQYDEHSKIKPNNLMDIWGKLCGHVILSLLCLVLELCPVGPWILPPIKVTS